jgi:hypothetical protein
MSRAEQGQRRRRILALLLPYAVLCLAVPFLHTHDLDEVGLGGRPSHSQPHVAQAQHQGSGECLACEWIHSTSASPGHALTLSTGAPSVAIVTEQPISAYPCPTHDPAGIRGPPQA